MIDMFYNRNFELFTKIYESNNIYLNRLNRKFAQKVHEVPTVIRVKEVSSQSSTSGMGS